MSFKDFTKIRRNVDTPQAQSVYGALLIAVTERITGLNLFYRVGPQIRAKQTIKCPSCVVVPEGIEIAEGHLSGNRFQNDYLVNVAILVKGPDDVVILQNVLYYAQAIRESFLRGSASVPMLVFSGVSGHYRTHIRASTIEPVEIVASDVLVYSSGMTLVFSTWEDY